MLDFTGTIQEGLAGYALAALAEAVDDLDALITDPALGTEYGPTQSDILQAAIEVIELADKVGDPVAREAAKAFALEIYRGRS